MVPRLHLALTAPGLSTVALTQWFLTLFAIACLMITALTWWSGQQINTEIIQSEQDITQLQAQNHQLTNQAASKGIDLSERTIQALPQEIIFAKQIRQLQSFSWTQFLNDLEAAVPKKVSMDSVILNFKDASISLSGSASTLNDLNNLVNGLEAHPAFHYVVLSQHAHKTKRKNKDQKHVAFTMTVSYQPI